MGRLIVILALFAIIGVVGSISGFLSIDHDRQPCVKGTPHFVGWGDFQKVWSIKINWPNFNRTCPFRYDPETKTIFRPM